MRQGKLANSNWHLAKVRTGDLTAKDAEGAKAEKIFETQRNGGSGTGKITADWRG
jgi:hypothetical protein